MIRAYRSTDEDAIVDIWYLASQVAHSFLELDFLKKEEKNIREIYLPNTLTWVYEVEREVVGFIAMMGKEVGALFVKPAHHRRGIGTKLLDHVARTHPELELEVFKKNTIGRAFYDKYGFQFLKEYIHEETGQEMWLLRFAPTGPNTYSAAGPAP